MKIKLSIYYSVLILIYIFLNTNISSSSMVYNNLFLISDNNINYGFERTSNLLNFNFDANIKSKFSFGDISLFQKYYGDAANLSDINYRNDEVFQLAYKSIMMNSIQLFSVNNWIMSADNLQQQNNKFQRVNSNIGLIYNLNTNAYLSIAVGLENNQQKSIDENGIVYTANYNINYNFLKTYKLNSKFDYEHLKLFDERCYDNLLFDINGIGKYSVGKDIYYSTKYLNNKKDFISFFGDSRSMQIENRIESKLMNYFKTDYKINKQLSLSGLFNINNNSIIRRFNDFSANNINSGITRNRDEFNTDFSANLVYKNNSTLNHLNFVLLSRNETNILENNSDIDNKLFQKLKEQSNSLDNSSNTFSIINKFSTAFSLKDSLYCNFLYSVNKYDTPDIINNDDKDELNSVIMIAYTNKISPYLKYNIEGEARLRHIVFLKQQRSAGNNRNQIIRLKNSIFLNYSLFKYYFGIEVLANYTVYDFRNTSANINSYSFRQINYTDSIKIHIKNNFYLDSKNNIRYFVNGILLWDYFSEIPEIDNLEYETLTQFCITKNTLLVAVGIRAYWHKRNYLSNSENLIFHYSIGPNININKEFSRNSTIQISGWYEKQVIANRIKYIPNLKLNCRVRF